jgi:hypothetical protein
MLIKKSGTTTIEPKAGILSTLLKAVFSASPRRGNLLSAGFAVWVVKTMLKGLAALALTAGVKNMISPKTPSGETGKSQEQPALSQQQEEEVTHKMKEIPYFPQEVPHNLKSSGRGQDIHKNDEDTVWWAQIRGSVGDTLISWAEDIYPELADHDNEIRISNSFNRMVNILGNNVYNNYIRMPEGLNTRKQVVDKFVGDVASKIKV